MDEAERCGAVKGLTGFVTHDAMKLHACLSGSHPECPDRIARIVRLFQSEGILRHERLVTVEPRPVKDEEIETVHTADHHSYIDSLAKLRGTELKDEGQKWDSVYFNRHSSAAARMAAGSCVAVTEAVCTGSIRNAIAVVRPPGHHAEEGCCMGFSLYNNVAIAASVARKKFDVPRVLIVDWDVHHGNGTQKMFENDPNVLYISLHRFDDGKYYPQGPAGAPTTVGHGAGEGYSVNVGWSQGKNKIGDAEYLMAFNQVVMPIATEFNPDLVFISAGFDAARGDPLGGCLVTPECYARLTHMLCGLAEGRVIMALEGGYNLTSISTSFAACAKVLLGEAPPPFSEELKRPHKGAMKDIRRTIAAHQAYWSFLTPVADEDNASRASPPIPTLETRVSAMSLTDELSSVDTSRIPAPVELSPSPLTPEPESSLEPMRAATLAATWYARKSPFSGHYRMVPLDAAQVDGVTWLVRYTVIPDTGEVYDRHFTFSCTKNRWRCIAMASWDPTAPPLRDEFDQVKTPVAWSTIGDWIPTSPHVKRGSPQVRRTTAGPATSLVL